MFGDGVFQPQLNAVEALLKRLDLFEARNLRPTYSLGASFFRKLTYRQVWETCFREYQYDFILADRSLLTFEANGGDEHAGELRYAYYECPFQVKPFNEFSREIIGGDVVFGDDVSEFGYMLREEYDQYVSQCDLRGIVTPVRYDYKASDYRAGCHPASHVHFGHNNDIRVGTKRIMLPMSFALLIARQAYPDKWAKLLKWDDSEHLCRNVRESLVEVHADYWGHNDARELFLH